MKVICGIEFADSLEVLFKLKELKGHKTVQETYRILEGTEIDGMFATLHAAYNCAHKNQELTYDQFIALLASKNLGFLKVSEAYGELVNALMFGGMTEQEVEERKNQIMNLQK